MEPAVSAFPPQPVRVPELLGLSVRRAACELDSVWWAQRKEVCGLRTRGPRPQVQRVVENGRALEELLVQAGLRYVKALKRARSSEPKRRRK